MTTTLDRYRPFRPMLPATGFWQQLLAFLASINFLYWLQRAPMFLLSLPAAYGVSAFMGTLLPVPFNWFAGIGFESVYLGCIALADQMFDEDDFTTILWWALNVIAVIVSALINTLFASHYQFSGVQAESFVHGIPLPVLSFGYSLLLHKVTNKNAARDFKIEQDRLEKQRQQEEYEKANPYLCECGLRFPDNRRRANHRRSCETYRLSME